MWKQLLFVVFSACVADGVEGTPGSLSTDEGSSQAALSVLQRLDDPQCKLLPPDDGACTHACDPDALKAFIPPNTCASFACTLTDGTTVIVGGCNR